MELKKIYFKYKTSHEPILTDFNLKISEDNIHFIIGENGSGKTTLYEIIAGLLDYEGKINNRIDPQDILLQLQGVPMLKTMTGQDLADLILGANGVKLNDYLISSENKTSKASAKKIFYLLKATFGNMSVGERRWLTIYLFCQLDREMYIFDEPTAGLDIKSAKEILKMIEKLSTIQKKKVLLTTHRLEEMSYFNEFTVTILKNGKNEFTGLKPEFKSFIK